jgi:hypothetical protein
MTERQRHPNWTPEQASLAAEIWQEHFTDVFGSDDWKDAPKGATTSIFHRIATAVARPYESVWNRYTHFGPKFGATETGRRKVSPQALAERVAREQARDRRGLTATFFGDPPVGFSALDRRRQQEAGR